MAPIMYLSECYIYIYICRICVIKLMNFVERVVSLGVSITWESWGFSSTGIDRATNEAVNFDQAQ